MAPWYGNRSSIKSVEISDRVTSICYYAFYGCTSLTSITIPDSVTSIGKYAFYNTAYYNDSNNWFDGVLYIGNHLIKAQNSTLLSECVIKEGTKTIANSALSNCSNLMSVTIPNSMTKIGDRAFLNCSNLVNVYYTGDIAGWCGITFAAGNSNPMRYAENLYINHEILTNAVIPDGITEIKNYAFYNCTKLTSVTIPDSITTIGDYAFNDCTSLRSITIPESVKAVGELTFNGCDRMTELSIMNPDIKIGEHAFCFLSSLRICKLPEGMKEIPNGFLMCAETLSSIVIPDGVETIGKVAFNSCYCLKKMYIPKSVKAINQGALSQCFNFESIYYEGTEEEWNKINLDTADNGFIVNAKMFFNSQIEDMGVSKEDVVNKADLQMRLDIDTASLNYGDVLTLGTIITGAGSLKYFVTYSSSNEKIATVDENGNVTAHQKGKAVITCTVTDSDGNKFTDTCDVTVNFTFVHWLLYIICFGWIWM